VIKAGEIVLQRQNLSRDSGRLFSVDDDNLFSPHLSPNLCYQGTRDPDDLRRANEKDRKNGGVSEYEAG
jgi:hypothetical protein